MSQPTDSLTPEQAAAIAAQQIGDPEFEEALKQLSVEEIQTFVVALQQAMRKRRVMLIGYLAALISVILGMVFALVMYAGHEQGTFVGWVFLVPFGLAAACMLTFGRIANRIELKVGDIRIDTRGRAVDKQASATRR